MARRPVNRVIGLCHASSTGVGRLLGGAALVMIGLVIRIRSKAPPFKRHRAAFWC